MREQTQNQIWRVPFKRAEKSRPLVPSAQGDLTINFSTSFAVHSRSYIALGHVSCIISF